MKKLSKLCVGKNLKAISKIIVDHDLIGITFFALSDHDLIRDHENGDRPHLCWTHKFSTQSSIFNPEIKANFYCNKNHSYFLLFSAIESYCKDRKTYKLQEESRILDKRSVGENDKFQFVEFSGKKFVKYNIVNLADI